MKDAMRLFCTTGCFHATLLLSKRAENEFPGVPSTENQ
jgi:hypothetical protein